MMKIIRILLKFIRNWQQYSSTIHRPNISKKGKPDLSRDALKEARRIKRRALKIRRRLELIAKNLNSIGVSLICSFEPPGHTVPLKGSYEIRGIAEWKASANVDGTTVWMSLKSGVRIRTGNGKETLSLLREPYFGTAGVKDSTSPDDDEWLIRYGHFGASRLREIIYQLEELGKNPDLYLSSIPDAFIDAGQRGWVKLSRLDPNVP